MNYQQPPANQRTSHERQSGGNGMLFMAILFLGFNTYLLFEMKQDVEHLRETVAEVKGLTQERARSIANNTQAQERDTKDVALAKLRANSARRRKESSLPPPSETEQLAGARSVPYFRKGEQVGIRLFAVDPQGRCSDAGFENGDMLIKIDDEKISNSKLKGQLDQLCQGRLGRKVELERRNKLITVTLR